MDKEKENMRNALNKLPIDGRELDEVVETLVNAGYGDTKQAVREFAEKAQQGLLRRAISRGDYAQVKADIQTVFGELLAEVTGE